MSSPRPGASLAVAAALLAVVAVASAVASTVVGGGHPRVEANVVANPNGPAQVITARNSPALARNPVHPSNVVVVDQINRPAYSAELSSSSDAGRTWRHLTLPLPAGRNRPYAPDAAFAPDGTLYVSYLNLEGVGNDPQTLWLARSTDGGTTLSAPVGVANHLVFQPRLAVGPDGTIYLTWLQGYAVGNLSLVGPPAPVVLVRSTDGGRTFSRPLPVSDPSRRLVGAASPAVGSDGSVLVLYEDFNRDVRDFENLDGPVWELPFALVVTRSTDGGRSFTPGVVVDSDLVATSRFLVYQPTFPSLAAGPSRSLYVAWSDGRSGIPEVYLKRSADGGATWGRLVQVDNSRPADTTTQELPEVAVAPDGRVDLVFLDGRRSLGPHRLDAELATSTNQGASFTTVALSSTSFDATVGPRTGPAYLPTDLGSRLGLSSADGSAAAAWTDTRQGTQNTGRQDVETATITGLASGRGGLVDLAIGLALAALVSLGARWLVARRALATNQGRIAP